MTDWKPSEVLRGVRILLVEDDPDTRDVVSTLLQQSGCSVRTATSADAALTMFEEHGCDVVITDYALPGSATGYQLLKRIRAMPVDAHVPVIGYSAHAGLVSQREQAAFSAYTPKPEMLEELVTLVAKVLKAC